MPITHSRFVHLPIDLEQSQDLPGSHSKSFPAAVRSFADAVQPIETIWVGFTNRSEFKLYAQSLLGRTDHLRDQHYIDFPVTTKGEDVFIKNDCNAFAKPGLAEHLNDKGVETVVLTGMYAYGCVFDTMRGALKNGFNCVIIADKLHDGKAGGDPSRYAKFFEEWLSKNSEYRDRVKVVTADQFIASPRGEFVPATARKEMHFA